MHIVLTENCTADGVIDMAAGWFDPADRTDDQLVAVDAGTTWSSKTPCSSGRQHVRGLPETTGPNADRRHHRHHRPPEPGPEVRALDDAAGPRVAAHNDPARPRRACRR